MTALGVAGLIAVGVAAPASARDGDGARAGYTWQASFPCGWRDEAPAQYDHVIWIWMENTSFKEVIGSSQAPALNFLSQACGTAASSYGLTHPSFRNYIAATGGLDWHYGPPSCNPLDVLPIWGPCGGMPFPSLFNQVASAGKQWRVYSESMPSNCDLTDAPPNYEVHHNPAPYYADSVTQCAQWNVPMGTLFSGALHHDLQHNDLPAFSFLIPDETHNVGGLTQTAAGDKWIGQWMAEILTSPAYLSGKTAVVITADEGDNGLATNEDCAVTLSAGCHIPTLVITPSVQPGTVSQTVFNHYSLLRTTEEMLGLPLLGDAATAPSMRVDFNS
jgi:hypothetical protein